MELRYYLIENRMHATDFADKLGVHRNSIYRILSGKGPCSISLALLIEKHTHGKVSRFEVPMSQKSIDILLGNMPQSQSDSDVNI